MIIYLLAALLFILLCYGTGTLLTYSLRLRLTPSLLPLIKVTSGLIAIISLYAIFITKGKTIMVFMPIIGCILYFKLKKQSPQEQYTHLSTISTEVKKILVPLLTLSILVILAFSWQAYFYKDCLSFSALPHIDYIYYAQVASSLNTSGTETTWLHFQEVEPAYTGLMPYHYFELWACAFIIKLTGLNQVAILLLVIYPVLFALTAYSLIQLTKLMIPTKPLISYLSVMFLFIAPINWAKLEGLGSFELVGILNNIKYLPITMLIILFVIALYKKTSLAYLVLLLIPICSITVAPAVIGGIILYKILSYLPFGPFKKTEANYSLTPVLLVAIGIGLFYFVFSNKMSARYSYLNPDLLIAHFKTVRNIVIGTPLFLCYLFVPFFIPLLLYYKKTFAALQAQPFLSLLIWYLCISASGLFIYMLIFAMPDASQLFVLFAYLGLGILLIVLYLEVYKISGSTQYLYLGLTVVPLLVATYAVVTVQNNFNYNSSISNSRISYMQKVDSVFQLHPEWRNGFSIKKSEEFSNIFEYNVLIFHPGMFMGLSNNQSNTVNLNGPELSCADTDTINAIRKSNFQYVAPFTRFTSAQVPFQLSKMDSLRTVYIQNHHFPYGFVSDSSLIPSGIKNNIATKITDSQRGEVFVVLKEGGRP